jgi:hypothetical protein
MIPKVSCKSQSYSAFCWTDDRSMGSMLYVLGNVRVSQMRMSEAYDLHNRALDNWRKTYGEAHHKTGDAFHKRAWHEARLRNFNDAKYNSTKTFVITT